MHQPGVGAELPWDRGYAAVHITFNIFKKKKPSYFNGKLLQAVCANSSSHTHWGEVSSVIICSDICRQGKITSKSGEGTGYPGMTHLERPHRAPGRGLGHPEGCHL